MDLKKFLKIFLAILFLAIIVSVIFLIKDLQNKKNLKVIEKEKEESMQAYQNEIENFDMDKVNVLKEENPDIDI